MAAVAAKVTGAGERKGRVDPGVAWEIHIADSPRRVVNFRYPTSTTNPGKDWKPGPDDVLVASCCFAVLGEGDAYQWPDHSESSARYVANAILGGNVVQGVYRARDGNPTALVGPDPRVLPTPKKKVERESAIEIPSHVTNRQERLRLFVEET